MMNLNSPSWRDNWARYSRWCQGARYLFPEFLESGLLLCRPEPVAPWWHRQGHYLRRLLRFVVGRDPRSAVPWRATFVICYHTKSESVRVPFERLARKLSLRGQNALLCGPQETWLWENGEARDVSAAFARGWGAARLYSMARAALATLWLSFCALIWGDFRTACDVGRTWYELTRSASRRRSAGRWLHGLQARVVLLSHERFAPGASFATARWKGQRLLYSHGTPTVFEVPVVSQQVLTWNATSARMWAELVGNETLLLTVGNTEVEQVLERLTPGESSPRRALLFLSECTPGDEYRREISTREALRWLHEAVSGVQGWEIWVKERAYHDAISLVFESEGLAQNTAFHLVSASQSFAELVAAPEVRGVAAFSSSGLYVAAAVGKTALRLLVPGAEAEIPVLDEVALSVGNPQALRQWMAEQGGTEKGGSVPEPTWRGALSRIEACCLATLGAPAPASP